MAFADLIPVRLKQAPRGSIRALHLSDLHFTADTFSNQRNANDLRKIFRSHLQACHQDCPLELIFVTGDVVDNAKMRNGKHREVLKQSKDFLLGLCGLLDIDPLKGLIVIPGNHDMKWKGIVSKARSRKEFERYFPGFDEHRYFPDLDLVVACFDSNDTRDWGELATGLVDLHSINRLKEQLAALDSQPSRRIALVHHHPLPVPASEFLERNRLIGRTTTNAPEFMLLRNGGRLVQRLLDANFQLILHGHLHCRNYWGPVYGVGGGENWLEVVSGVSLCEDREHRHGFGIITIGEDSTIEYEEHRFDNQGSLPEKFRVPMVPYAKGRERTAKRLAEGAIFRCDRFHKIINVVHPEGDIYATEIFAGFQNTTLEPQESFILPARSSALTRQELDGCIPGNSGRVTIRRELIEEKGEKFIRYTLVFNPKIQPKEKVTLLLQRKTDGAMFSSEELQKFWGFAQSELGTDRVTQTIWIPCEELNITLRFNASLSKYCWRPKSVWVEVRDKDKKLSASETAFATSNFDYMDSSGETLTTEKFLGERPEVALAVHKPFTGYKYCICWGVPTEESIDADESASLSQLRPRVIQRLRDDTLAEQFLDVCLEKIREILARTAIPYINDKSIHACLFGIDTSTIRTGKEDCAGTSLVPLVTNPNGCALSTRLDWGRDIIGRAARQGVTVSLNRSALEPAVEVLHRLPQNIENIIAIPLFCYDRDRFPVAVVAIATTERNSSLNSVIDLKSPAAKEVTPFVQALWKENFEELLGLSPAKP